MYYCLMTIIIVLSNHIIVQVVVTVMLIRFYSRGMGFPIILVAPSSMYLNILNS